MANPDGPTATALAERVRADPFAHDFFRAVRWLQALAADRPRIGCSLTPADDPVRFAQLPYLRFAPSTLQPPPNRESHGGTAPRFYSHHFGLFGPNGPLPLHLTEYARDRIQHHGDRTFSAFCDIFHHRLISFFFRAWAEAHKEVDLDRAATAPRSDQRWPIYIGSLFGLGTEEVRDRDAVPDRAKLYYSGRLAAQPRNAEGLEAILGDFFGVPCEVQTFVGRWLTLPPDSVCRLGESPATGCLGESLIVGSRVWDCQLGFRIRFGPLVLDDFERLLPCGVSFTRLRDWVRNYAHEQYLWDVQLVLRGEEVPATRLGGGGRLGWNTWLKSKPFDHDAEDLILRPHDS